MNLREIEEIWMKATPQERLAILLDAYGPKTRLKHLDTGIYLTHEQTLDVLAKMTFTDLWNGVPVPHISGIEVQ